MLNSEIATYHEWSHLVETIYHINDPLECWKENCNPDPRISTCMTVSPLTTFRSRVSTRWLLNSWCKHHILKFQCCHLWLWTILQLQHPLHSFLNVNPETFHSRSMHCLFCNWRHRQKRKHITIQYHMRIMREMFVAKKVNIVSHKVIMWQIYVYAGSRAWIISLCSSSV